MMESMRRLEARVDNMCERFEARISILEAQRSAADAFSGSTAENTNPITGRPHTPQKKAVTAVDDKTTPIRDFPRALQKTSSHKTNDNTRDEDAAAPDYAWPMDLVLY